MGFGVKTTFSPTTTTLPPVAVPSVKVSVSPNVRSASVSLASNVAIEIDCEPSSMTVKPLSFTATGASFKTVAMATGAPPSNDTISMPVARSLSPVVAL